MERVVTVVPEAGLHARPASRVVRTANEHDAEVRIAAVGRDGDPVSAASMLAVTGLNVAQGDEVRLIAEGPDAEAALDAIAAILTAPVEDEQESAEEGTDAGER